MTNDLSTWFRDTFEPISIDVDTGTIEVPIGYGSYTRIASGNARVTIKLNVKSFESLIVAAKIGQEETMRRIATEQHPNVQAAYEEYLTLLALTQKYGG